MRCFPLNDSLATVVKSPLLIQQQPAIPSGTKTVSLAFVFDDDLRRTAGNLVK